MEDRFSFTDAELGLPPERPERTSNINAWVARQPEVDPTPRHEVARVFFKDAVQAAMRIH